MDYLFMMRLALVGAGGCCGAVLRYLVSGYVQAALRDAQFPYGTLAVNLTGCFVIGLLSQLADARGLFTTESRLFLFTGVLGGYTTFSTFANESMNLLRDGQGRGSGRKCCCSRVRRPGCGMAWPRYRRADVEVSCCAPA
jgi:CrcB protein